MSLSEGQFVAAVPAPTGELDIFFHQSHILIFLLASALAVLWIGLNDNGANAVPLAAAALLFLTAPLSLTIQFTTGIGASRLIPNFSAVLAAAIAAVYVGNSKKYVKYAVATVLVVLVTMQAFAVVTTPDYPGTPRSYLEQSEVDAKEFTHQYVSGNVTTDYWYGTETIDALPGPYTDSRVSFNSETEGYVNGTLADEGHEYILYRTEPKVYRFKAPGSWQLTWDPEPQLEQGYSGTYDNGDVRLYT